MLTCTENETTVRKMRLIQRIKLIRKLIRCFATASTCFCRESNEYSSTMGKTEHTGLFWWPWKSRKQGAAIKAGYHKATPPPPPPVLLATLFVLPFLPLSGPIPPLPSAQVEKNSIQTQRLISVLRNRQTMRIGNVRGRFCFSYASSSSSAP